MKQTGRILKGIGGFYYVSAEDGRIYACRAKGIFRLEGISPLPGDMVTIEILDEKDLEGSLTHILPRKNALIRPAIANADQALVIFSIHEPEPNLLLLDRFLVTMGMQHLPVLICFNKADISTEKEREELRDIYTKAGYPVLFTSAKEQTGLEELRSLLKNRVTAAAGPSGAGKSSVINRLQSRVQMETGEISRKLKRGRHTTRHAQLIPLDHGDSFLADTPGFTSLVLPSVEPVELGGFFPEFDDHLGQCRFQGCLHEHEPDCSVKQAVLEGRISQIRYEHYLELLQEARFGKRR